MLPYSRYHSEQGCAARSGREILVEEYLSDKDTSARSDKLRTRDHTNAAESIDNLVSLLLIVQLPGMLECSDSLMVHLRSLVLLSKVQTIEDKNTGHAEVLENLQLLLDIASEGERKPSESN